MISKEFFTKLQKWQSEGRRSFTIEKERDEPAKVWVYDYTVMAGTHIDPAGGALPSTTDLVAKKRANIQSELDELEATHG